MKEIKFRALDIGTDEWLYFTLRDLIVGDASKNLRLKNWCRYTSVKDKNGKEIYEEDIVLYKWLSNKLKGMVKFINGHFVVDEESHWILGTDVWSKECEVIGNIHENSELLKEKNEER